MFDIIVKMLNMSIVFGVCSCQNMWICLMVHLKQIGQYDSEKCITLTSFHWGTAPALVFEHSQIYDHYTDYIGNGQHMTNGLMNKI